MYPKCMPLVVDQPIWPPWVLTMPNRQELGLLTYSVAQDQVRLVGHRVWGLITCLTWVNGLTGHNQWNYNGLTDLSATCWCVYTSRPSCNLSKPWVWVNIPTSWQKILIYISRLKFCSPWNQYMFQVCQGKPSVQGSSGWVLGSTLRAGDQPASKWSLSLLSQRPKWLYRDWLVISILLAT